MSKYQDIVQAAMRASIPPRALTPVELKLHMQKGLWVWWHPDGPTKWIMPGSEDAPLIVERVYSSPRVHGCFVVEVRRVDDNPITFTRTKDGGMVGKHQALRCIDQHGVHHKECTPVFTDHVPPGYRRKPQQDEREKGDGIRPPYGTIAEQENEERWGPMHEHDPNKHCKACGAKGGCLCPRDKQVDDE